jgi:UDP-3-O-[3-hydroxymyristoyl] glucosamine N-acyltransferase
MHLIKPITVSETAHFLNCPFKGDGTQIISGLNEIHKVKSGDLTFVDVAKYYSKALNSAATAILINSEVEVPVGKSIIISDDPFRDYNRLVTFFRHPEHPQLVDLPSRKDITIGENCTIYPGVYLGSNVSIGDNCTLYPNVVLYDDVHLGNNVVIHAGSILGAHAFYFKNRRDHFEKLESCGRVIIKDDVEIGAACTIDKGVSGDTIIGEHTKLDNQVHIGHGVEIGARCLIGAQVGIGGKTTIEDEVVIWGQAGITKDVRIGKGALISAQSGVSKSLEGGKAYFGTPAQELMKAQREQAWLRQKATENNRRNG